MKLLDHNGKPQFDLEGGEIIFSRVFTKKVLEMISKGEKPMNVGKAVYDERIAQKNRKQQVVKN